MRFFIKGLLFILLVSVGTMATANESNFYVGVVAGALDADFADSGSGDDSDVAPAGNLGLRAGYQWNNSFGFEAEYTGSVGEGTTYQDEEWWSENLGLFATYKAGNTVYFKAKAGYMYSWLEYEVYNSLHGILNRTGDGGTAAYGLGLGFNFGRNAGLELEYTGFEMGGWDASLVSATMAVKF